MLRPTLLVLALILSFTACGKKDGKSGDADNKAAQTLKITAEDLLTVQNNALASGPVITGSIQPERRADLRAELSAIVLQVLKENGESVKKGDILVRLDDTSIRDSMNSAEESARASAQSLDQAERQLQRLKTLRAKGMTSTQQLEDAEVRRNNTQSDLAASKARAVQARQQLQRTEVRAPFDGIVSERKVSAGDTAQIGKELVKVIDPASMRFQGLISADKVTLVTVGQAVSFRVNGYEKEFAGKVKRVDPAANATTRQVEVLVDFVGSDQPRISGLYAEGRIETGTTQVLMVSDSALVRDGDKAYVWSIKDGILKKTNLVIGERDARRGDYAVKSGLSNGDKVIQQPLSTLIDGQKVEMVASAASTTAAADKASSAASSAATSAANKPTGK